MKVVILKKIHSKTLIKDNNLITEGSFNWLSAVRKDGADHQREERTMVSEGYEVRRLIEKEMAKLDKLEKEEGMVLDKDTKTEVSLDKPFEPLTKGTITWIQEPTNPQYRTQVRDRKVSKPYKGESKLPKSFIFCIMVVFLALIDTPFPVLRGIGIFGAFASFIKFLSRVISDNGIEPVSCEPPEMNPLDANVDPLASNGLINMHITHEDN